MKKNVLDWHEEENERYTYDLGAVGYRKPTSFSRGMDLLLGSFVLLTKQLITVTKHNEGCGYQYSRSNG